MARADTLTKLPIDEWFRIMGVNPLHANQVQLESVQNEFCGQLWFQHGWQKNTAIGREALAQAIAQAERNIETYLGYTLLPTWHQDERRPTSRANRPELVLGGRGDVRSYAQAVPGIFKQFIAGGQRAADVLEAAAAIVWSDEDGDGYKETGTVTVAKPSGQDDTCEVKLYYPGKAASPIWEIRPLTSVTAVGATWVITVPRHYAVKEALQEALVPDLVNGLTDASFLATVDVYRVYNDPQAMASLLWEPLPTCGCFAGTTCVVCQYTTQTACLIARGDPANGVIAFQAAIWDATAEAFSGVDYVQNRAPDLLRLWYYAGMQDKSQACCTVTMDPYWATVVAQYAAALLSKPPCACIELDVARWQQDLAFAGGAEELSVFAITPGDLSNPFGTRRGALQAWKAVNTPGVQFGVGALSV